MEGSHTHSYYINTKGGRKASRVLKKFEGFFSKPQYYHFTHYVTGLIASDDKKNIFDINESFKEKKDQSSLSRFLSKIANQKYQKVKVEEEVVYAYQLKLKDLPNLKRK